MFAEFFQHLPPEPVVFDPQTVPKHRDLLTFTLNVPLGLFDTLIDRCLIEAPSLVARLKEIYGEVLTEARRLIGQLDKTGPIDLASWFQYTDSNIPFAARRLRRMAALLRPSPDPPGETEEDTARQGGQPRGETPAGAGDTTPYVELNLAKRTLTIGDTPPLTPSRKVWDFLKELADEKRHGVSLPRASEWKNAMDMLRRKIGKDGAKCVIAATPGGYRLASNVKLTGGGQIGIRKAKQSR